MVQVVDAKRGAFNSAVVQRIAITVGALLIAQIGTFIPFPGLDDHAVELLYASSGSHLPIPRLSVCALGVTPILSALILAEVLMLINSSKRRLPVNAATSESFNRGILIAALILAALQAWGIASGLEGIERIVVEPGVIFRTGCIVTLVAATALLSWLATVITRHGLGSGIWFLLLTPELAHILKAATSMKTSADMGIVPFEWLLLPVGLFAALALALVALERANPGLAASGSTIWPLILSATYAGWLVIPALVYFSPDLMNGSIARPQPRYYAFIFAFAILVPVFSLWRMQSIKNAGTGSADIKTPVAITGVLTAIMTTVEYMIAKTGFYELPDGEQQVMAVAVALCTLQAVGASRTGADQV